MSSLGQIPHLWYPLTTGLQIDLDALPGPRGVDAVLARMLRLLVEEEIELRASVDPGPLWRRLALADPGGYGFITWNRDLPPGGYRSRAAPSRNSFSSAQRSGIQSAHRPVQPASAGNSAVRRDARLGCVCLSIRLADLDNYVPMMGNIDAP
jgi:hypothetical protein